MAFLSELPPNGIPQWELVLSPGLIERRRTTLHGGVVRGGVAAHVNDGRCREPPVTDADELSPACW